ncbi:hypothetical protein ROLI_029610 [Roseobacter fucihabitans]|uniref:NADH:ubiquinone oxidoreductase intermediate-associated protein 30 domain-containing protein n=1 Tax=Roseobacter fucihabitans TaxID=1537242 RepID=A0ABZ2BVP1_9RHOB|nr:CIA30 family protein [Roseobacter litoralis]MBC6965295.1 Complex I intermediate-associated protein 30 (CIA30) [Roseobacter litoralis]
MTERLTPDWEFIADGVMGGVSQGSLTTEKRKGRTAVRLYGEVSTENNGGFLQMAFDINASGSAYDASRWTGIEVDVLGNGETYEMRLRTNELDKPWQSFRQAFQADKDWRTVQLPFADFTAHRHDLAFDPAHLRRLGVLAVGREFHADIALAQVRFYN